LTLPFSLFQFAQLILPYPLSLLVLPKQKANSLNQVIYEIGAMIQNYHRPNCCKLLYKYYLAE